MVAGYASISSDHDIIIAFTTNGDHWLCDWVGISRHGTSQERNRTERRRVIDCVHMISFAYDFAYSTIYGNGTSGTWNSKLVPVEPLYYTVALNRWQERRKRCL